MRDSSLLLVLPLSVHQKDGRVYIERQAANGLARWLQNFSRMTLAVILLPGSDIPIDSVPIDALGLSDRLDVALLPSARRPLAFFRTYAATRRLLADLIDQHEYLQFAIGGAWGDWGAVGGLIAAGRGRKASVWTDRVESEVLRIDAARTHGFKKPFKWLNYRIARGLERRVIRQSALGLFHGKDTFEAYRPFSPNPQLVHDIHLKAADRISPGQLDGKLAHLADAELDIIYAGRLHPDKGVMDWIETLRLVAEADVRFRGRWFGDGPQLEDARAKVESLGLADRVEFPGLLMDRDALLNELRTAHLMLFCHQTPESPRCLIEALVSGTPIVGYRSAYPEDLILAHGGGLLTPKDPSKLAAEVIAIAHDRASLAALIGKAAQDGHGMNDEAVFMHRSELMKQHS